MNGNQAESLILEYLTGKGAIAYGDMLKAIEDIPQDRMAHYLFRLRNNGKIKMTVTAQRDEAGKMAIAHTVQGVQ